MTAEVNIKELFGDYEFDDEPDFPFRCHFLEDDGDIETLKNFLISKLPDCYATAEHLETRARVRECSTNEVLCNRLPTRGNIKAGDFGEILTLFFLSSERTEEELHQVMKWRYKENRQSPAHGCDILILHAADEPEDDFVIVAESKMKSTNTNLDPINSAIDGMSKDTTARLARTLAWLEEKYLDEGSTADIEFVERFTNASRPTYQKLHKAVAIVDADFLDDELRKELDIPASVENCDYEIIALGVNDLKDLYEAVFQHFHNE
jgi:hypothetical protein